MPRKRKFDNEKFSRILELEITISSILVGFLVTAVSLVIERFRGESVGGVYIVFMGWLSLQAGILFFALLTIVIFFIFIAIGICTLEQLAYRNESRSLRLYNYGRVVLLLGGLMFMLTFCTLFALIWPDSLSNTIVSIFVLLMYLLVFVIVGKVFYDLIAVRKFKRKK
jgi:magnesium-transporting ATPase (P-type)